MNNARILVVSVALCAIGLRAAVPTAAVQDRNFWHGVINHHFLARVQNDGGVTTTYRVYVKRSGESGFSLLGDAASAGGTAGQVISIPYVASQAATFRVCRVNADGEGTTSGDLNFAADLVNTFLGTLISSAPYDSSANNATANAADGIHGTCFNSAATDETWIGVDFCAPRTVTGVRFRARHDRMARMGKATVQVANRADFSDATNVFSWATTPNHIGVV